MDENENINGKVGKIQYISFGFIMSLNFFRFSILSTIIASFPSIQYDFTLTNVQLSLISAVFYLFSFVFTYLWIYLSGKYSNRLVFLIGGAFWILPLFYFPYIQSYAVLILVVALIGIGTESVPVLLTNYLVSLKLTKQFARVYSFQAIVQGAGGVFGTLLVILVQKFNNSNWGHTFIITAIVSCILFLITYFIMFLKFKKENPKGFENQKYIFNWNKIKELFKNRVNLLIVMWFLIAVPFIPFLNIWTQLYFINEHGVSQEVAIITFIYLSGIEFLGYISAGMITDYFKRKNNKAFKSLGFYAIGLSGIFFLLALLIPWELESVVGDNFIELCFNLLITVLSDFKITISYIFFTFAFFSYTFIDPYTASIAEYYNNNENKQIMLNINKSITALGYLVGPIIGGFIADLSNFLVMFLHIPIAFFVSLIPLFLIRNYTPKTAEE